ncbi:uncharacterized protein [Leptinotarsa decemlineata]|uniref:uncharacterized protein n=1 Tax=Leptinotarsa decemlineata TaxID=7539 RepID=UPI003D30970A
MENADLDIADVMGNVKLLEEKIEVIQDLDKQLLENMLEEDTPADDLDDEVTRSDKLLSNYNRLKAKIDRYLLKNTLSEHPSFTTVNTSQSMRNIKLPKIKLNKFCDDIKNWLPFWAQFSRIHTDESIPTENKFQYLIQATVPNSRARQLVESYPSSAENYTKVIERLKSRSGREDLLIEVYIRELLKLILTNLGSKAKLSYLHDQIESQLA